MRYFADGVITLKAIAKGLVAIDPEFKIDGGDLMRGKELLAEIELSDPSSDLGEADTATQIEQLEQVGSAAAQQVIARLRTARSIVTLRVLDGERDPAVTWSLLGPLWTILPSLSTGLRQSDGQGFYLGSRLLVPLD
jgi:hypothetical protein